MKVDNVGFNEKLFIGKTFEEFQEAMKGKLKQTRMRYAYDKIPQPKTVVKPPKKKVEVEK